MLEMDKVEWIGTFIKNWLQNHWDKYQSDKWNEDTWNKTKKKLRVEDISTTDYATESYSFSVMVGFLQELKLVASYDEAKSVTTEVLTALKKEYSEKLKLITVIPLSTLKTSFSSTYHGTAVELFTSRLNWCYDEWINPEPKKWHSPYFTIVQSSGYGKSRMCKEFALHNERWWSLYICLRREDSTGYPPRHVEAVNFLDSIIPLDSERATSNVRNWLSALQWSRIAFYDLYNQTQETQIELGTSFVTFLNNFYTTNIKSKEDFVFDNNERLNFWNICENPEQMKYLYEAVNNLLTTQGDIKTPRQGMKFFIILDEARYLLKPMESDNTYTLFRIIRGALQKFDNSFAVLVDTTSKLGNFAPPIVDDASYRGKSDVTLVSTTELFPPFTTINTMDIFKENSSPTNHNYVLGRPLWNTSLDGMTVKELLAFALDKLNLDKNGYLIVMSILMGWNISPTSACARELVARHMATCLHVNNTREYIAIAYPPEPILTQVAMNKFLCEFINNRMHIVAEKIFYQLRSGLIGNGDRGEILVKWLLLLAWSVNNSDDAYLNTVSDRPVFNLYRTEPYCASLESYFAKLFSLKVFQEVAKLVPDLDKCDVSFSCFTKISCWNLTFEEFWNHRDPEIILKECFERRVAIELPSNQPGADFMIPVRKELENNSYRYQFVLIQVKNVVKFPQSLVSKAITKLFPSELFPMSSWIVSDVGFGILMNVASEANEIHIKRYKYMVEDVGIEPRKRQRFQRKDDNSKRLAYATLIEDGQDNDEARPFIIAQGLSSNVFSLLNGQDRLEQHLKWYRREDSIKLWLDNSEKYDEHNNERKQNTVLNLLPIDSIFIL